MALADEHDKDCIGMLSIEVAYSPAPRQVQQVALQLPAGATLGQAVQVSQLLQDTDAAALGFGVWGRKASLSTVLKSGDRIEIYRALKVDPKEARRQRYRAHGEKLPKGIRRARTGKLAPE